MKTVWKWQFDLMTVTATFKMPAGASIVNIEYEKFSSVEGRISIWATIETTEAELVERTFTLYGTGHKVEENTVYVGTVRVGQFVFHLFEEIT